MLGRIVVVVALALSVAAAPIAVPAPDVVFGDDGIDAVSSLLLQDFFLY